MTNFASDFSNTSVVFIDDDYVFTFSSKVLFEKAYPNINLTTFTNNNQAIDFLLSSNALPDYVFLDLHMPQLSPTDFLDQLNTIEHDFALRSQLFLMSSSLFLFEKTNFFDYKIVTNLIEKPLTLEVLKGLNLNSASTA